MTIEPMTVGPVRDLPDPEQPILELTVVTFLEGVEQIGGGMCFAVVFDLVVALGLDYGTVFELEAVEGIFQIRLLDQHALEGGRVEAEGGAAFQPLLVGVAVDV